MNHHSVCQIAILSFLYLTTTLGALAQGVVDTGDSLDGVPVISALEVDALPEGRHRFYFQAGRRSTGQNIHVPVIVLKGQKPGKKLLLTAAVHGDELNGIRVIHRLFNELESETLAGTLVGVPGVNQTGLEAGNRHFLGSSGGGHMVDPNRIFPGSQTGGGAASLYIGKIWDKLLRGNADIAIDLHTQSSGAAYPLFVFADFGNRLAQQMAFTLMPDMIKNDPGQNGALETVLINDGIPAVTFELGEAGRWQNDMIERATRGIVNVMRAHEMLSGAVMKSPSAPVVGSSYTNVYAQEGGFAHIGVALKEAVEKGEHIATIVDPLGREIRRYYAPHDGHVLAVATAPLREAGAMLVRILQ